MPTFVEAIMDREALKRKADEAFDRCAEQDGLFYHVLNARRANGDSSFKPDAFVKVFLDDLDEGLRALSEASDQFEKHSVLRK